jgi:hypothetical protein
MKQVRSAALVILGCALFTVTGCKSASHYISPRVEGRVLDARSRQPVENVVVKRLSDNEQGDEPAKGGQALLPTDSVRTGPDGAFDLRSLKAVAFFRGLSWLSVSLSFEHPAYQTVKKTYTFSNATSSAAGEPLVQAGDILLEPNTQ